MECVGLEGQSCAKLVVSEEMRIGTAQWQDCSEQE